MKRNKFSKALRHLKSKKIDEKIKSLEEAAPTNNMSGVYQVTPSTSGDGFRMGKLDPAKKFYPKADGTWPAGIPADPSDRVYVKGAGYHTGKGAIPDNHNITPRDLSLAYMNANGNDTSTMIRPSDGMVYTDLPEGSRNFILGPLVTSYTQNHTSDDFTNLGYLQKDTRQFVLLGRIHGFLDGSKRLNGAARTWDGTANQFTSFNSNFTLEHALWMRDNYNAGNFTANVPFNLSGGIPADRHPDDPSLGGGDIIGTNEANEGGDDDDIGKPQDPPDENDIESLDLWGLIKDVLNEIGDRFKGVLGILDAIPPFLNFLAHQVNENSPWTDDNPFDVKINEAEADAIRNDIEEIFNEWGNDRVDEINEGSPMTPEEQNQVNEKINRDKTDGRGDALNAEYPALRLTLNNIGKPDAFEGNIQTNSDGTRTPIAIDDNYVFEGDDDASAPGAPDIIKFMLELPGVQEKIEKSDLDYPYRKDSEDPIDKFGTKEEIKNKNMPIRLDLTTNTSLIRRESLNLNRKRILREIRQPLKEIQELPKTTKLKGYRPNFKGKFSPQNTPDITASKISDDIVSAKNSSRQVWTAKDKYWKEYETTERMNIIYDNLGFGSQYFDRIVDENVRQKSKKSREVQEHLNMLSHQKAMREVYGIKEYQNKIDESETFDNKVNDPLFTKVANRLKKEIDYPKKPSPKGYPNEAPPKIDPNTGMHPKYGKRYKYDKLDPISAKTMAGAPTGDPEIDANVKKAAKIKEDWRSDLKNLWLGSEREDWKKKIKEDFVNTTQGMKVGQTFTHVPSGQTVTTGGVLGGIETIQTSVELFGDAIPGPDASQYGLQGFAKPIDIMRRGKKKTEELNKELDSSEDYTKEIKADEFMKARVKTELSLEQRKEAVKKYKNDLEEWNKKSEARARENESGRKSNLSKVRSFVAKYGENLDDIKGVQTFIKIAEEGKKLIVINQDSIFRDLTDKFNVRVYEAEEGKVITRQTGNFGRVDSSIFDNPFTNRKSSGQATIMYDGVGGEIESKNFVHKELPSIPMPEPPEHMKKNLSKGWQPVTKEDEGMINKLNTFFGTSVTGVKFAAKLAIQLARGDTTPITKSPGVGFDANATRVIHSAIKVALELNKTSYTNDNDSWYDPKTGMGQVMDNAYTILDNPIDNITRAALGKFTFKVTPERIQVIDDYDITKVVAIGGVSNPITDFISRIVSGTGGFTDQFGQSYDTQQLANLITGIAMRRGAELGFDMVDTDGQTIRPIYSGEDAYADSTQLATPKGFNIPINYTMPTGITIKNLLNPRQYTQNKRGSGVQPKIPTDRTGYGYDTKGKLDSSGYGMDPNRDTETEARPIKSSKSVNRIKNMAKARRQSLSLDEPIVKRKNKKS